MNTYELVSQTMRQCRMDPTDATDRSDNEDWIIAACNEAYRKICREKLSLWTVEAVTLDASKQFLISSLTEACVRILEITKYPDYYADNSYARANTYYWDLYAKTTVVVPDATASEAYYVKYEYLPDDLEVESDEPDETFVESETNTPQINEAWHPVLTYWATAQYYLSKGANYVGVANMWVGMFDRGYGEITDDVGEPQETKNAYHPWI